MNKGTLRISGVRYILFQESEIFKNPALFQFWQCRIFEVTAYTCHTHTRQINIYIHHVVVSHDKMSTTIGSYVKVNFQPK